MAASVELLNETKGGAELTELLESHLPTLTGYLPIEDTSLTTSDDTEHTIDYVDVAENTAVLIIVQYVVRGSFGGSPGYYAKMVKGFFYRPASGDVTLKGTVSEWFADEDITLELEADTGNQRINVNVQGDLSSGTLYHKTRRIVLVV